MIAVELVSDLGEGQRGLLSRQVHGELTGVGDRELRFGERRSSRETSQAEQTASWMARTLGDVRGVELGR